MKKEEPLIMRLHFQVHMYELVRLVGYEGAAVDDLRERVKPLVAAHGQPKMMAAAHELTQTDDKANLVTLRPNVRKIVFGVLGPPPERADYESYWVSQGVLPPNKRPKEEPPPKAAEAAKDQPPDAEKTAAKPKRTRKKTAK